MTTVEAADRIAELPPGGWLVYYAGHLCYTRYFEEREYVRRAQNDERPPRPVNDLAEYMMRLARDGYGFLFQRRIGAYHHGAADQQLFEYIFVKAGAPPKPKQKFVVVQ